MKTLTLNLETLGVFSPELRDDFEQQVKAAVADCRARPAVPKAREVTVVLKMTPHPGDPDDVWIEPVVKSKTPARALDPVRARRSRNDQLQFDFREEGDADADVDD